MVRCLSSIAVMSWPATTTRPESGGSSPASRCSSVLLPQPEGPMIATSSPWLTEKLTWLTTGRGVSEMLKLLLRFSATTISGCEASPPAGTAPPSSRPASDIEEEPQDTVHDCLQQALARGLAVRTHHLVAGGRRRRGRPRHRPHIEVGARAGRLPARGGKRRRRRVAVRLADLGRDRAETRRGRGRRHGRRRRGDCHLPSASTARAGWRRWWGRWRRWSARAPDEYLGVHDHAVERPPCPRPGTGRRPGTGAHLVVVAQDVGPVIGTVHEGGVDLVNALPRRVVVPADVLARRGVGAKVEDLPDVGPTRRNVVVEVVAVDHVLGAAPRPTATAVGLAGGDAAEVAIEGERPQSIGGPVLVGELEEGTRGARIAGPRRLHRAGGRNQRQERSHDPH